jgi:hypothetical protein
MKIITSDREKVTIKPKSRFRVALSPQLVKEWQELCGPGSVKIDFQHLENDIKRRSWKRNGNKGNGLKVAEG